MILARVAHGLMVLFRYQTKNLLVPIVIPGPQEPNAEELQEYLDLIVDDLLNLYYDGIDVKSANGKQTGCSNRGIVLMR